ncbi:hypothetical protein GCM10010300_80430 [Streptomyces olivaceoviridis]|nr:hypothetical protein GCM10010300_80430 [Streptomyces olivaceoviridis]
MSLRAVVLLFFVPPALSWWRGAVRASIEWVRARGRALAAWLRRRARLWLLGGQPESPDEDGHEGQPESSDEDGHEGRARG